MISTYEIGDKAFKKTLINELSTVDFKMAEGNTSAIYDHKMQTKVKFRILFLSPLLMTPF